MSEKSNSLQLRDIFKGKFLFLLLSLLLYLVLVPLLEGFVRFRILIDIFLTAILISGIYAVSQKKIHSVIVAMLALPMFGAMWSSHFVEIPSVILLGDCFEILFLSFIMVIIFSSLFRNQTVTLDVVYAAVVVYLLLGLTWAAIYSIMESLQPGSFSIAQSHTEHNRLIFVYYSFVTLTTLGYGDITPLTDRAYSFSILEALIG